MSVTTTTIRSTSSSYSTSNFTSSANEICFLCRFDMGFSIGSLEAGVVGLLIVFLTLCCCCLCYSVCIFCLCYNNKGVKEGYAPVDASQSP